ncbi:sensor histidine kinase [Virgisporangium aliadipatigenens]|nr:nitrate- and nitrite sensing domain-containing protein [Virgisporangium aliadipatigenens]
MAGHRRGRTSSEERIIVDLPRKGGGSVRGKLARLLAVPLVGVLLLLGDLVLKEVEEYTVATASLRSVELAEASQALVGELQRERAMTAGASSGVADLRGDLDNQRALVDATRAALARQMGGAEEDGGARAALARLDDLVAVRAQHDAGRIDGAAAYRYYTERIAALNRVDLGLDIPSPDPDTELRRGLAALQALYIAAEAVSAEQAVLLPDQEAGRLDTDRYARFVAAYSERQLALAEFNRWASDTQRGLVDAALSSPAGVEMGRIELQALDAAGRTADVNVTAWWNATGAVVEALRRVQEEVDVAVDARFEDLRSDARWDLAGLIPLALLCVVVAALLIRSASRSIVRPLAALVSEANDVAGRRLPETVELARTGDPDVRAPQVRLPERSSTEIRSVAHALDRVQLAAFTLARQEAVLRQNTVDSLANLGRRTQNLLRRQLGFISQLEREETDPTALGNLFELDHLATRMRRNAESLLVLVGETTPRRWATPMPITDVIRAAVAEVEEYRRVTLRRVDDAKVAGRFVADLAHMLAELMENALTFSPPDVDVEVHGRITGGRYLIAIVDHGIGMSPSELNAANARLRGEEDFTVAPTRYLGHYVVGHLARRLGVEVQVVQSPVTGVTARVHVPETLVVMPEEVEPPTRGAPDPGPARREIEAAPLAATVVRGPATAPDGPHNDALRPASFAGRPGAVADSAPVPAPRVPEPVAAPAGPPPQSRPGGSAPSVVTAQFRPISSPPEWPLTNPDAAGRTANGLPKRVPRARKPTVTPAAPAEPTVERDPAQTRSMLASLRAGVQRGESAGRKELQGDPR